MRNRDRVLHGLAIAGLSFAWACSALAAPAAHAAVGSGNVTVADPTVPRPPTQPCVVQLFSNDTFDDFATRPFNYAPPAGCRGNWSKVVLEADFSVTAGVQYDRTASIWLGGVNLYFGTTQEPGSNLAPSWHVERDLTDYTSLFGSAGQGQAIIGNVVNSTYNGVIHGSARLLFYPALAKTVRAADAVYPLGSDPVGSTVTLNDSTSQLTRTLSLPRNVIRAYLDVFAQSQNADEFWYTCVPDQFADEVDECGGGNFREVEVSIDGQPAGVAPVYPWIYTGGIDPFLWEPTPGVQTLNFMPYRVDLSPFAGMLSDGSPHQVAVSVAGANNYFSATAALLVYLDPNSKRISGRVTSNTLSGQQPTPTIGNTLSTDSSGDVTGDINTDLIRKFVIEGYANTAQGRVYNKVQSSVDFADTQGFTITGNQYRQVSEQLTTAASTSQSISNGTVTSQYQQRVQYPLHVDFNELVHGNGNVTLASTAQQGYSKNESFAQNGIAAYSAQVDNSVKSADTLDFDANFNFLGHSGQHSTQTFAFSDSLNGCYRSSVTSLNGIVTDYSSGAGCLGGINRVSWYAHPDGSPDSGSTQLGSP